MGHEWKKQEKEIYGVKTRPCVVGTPVQKYIIVSGNEGSNDEIFLDKVAVLFSMAYKIEMVQKALTEKGNEIIDYMVYLLEGIWSMAFGKEYLAKEELHKGAFDDEPTLFEIMDRYCTEYGYKRMGKEYRKMYLDNTNHAGKTSLKTILRYEATDIEKLQHTVIKEKRK